MCRTLTLSMMVLVCVRPSSAAFGASVRAAVLQTHGVALPSSPSTAESSWRSAGAIMTADDAHERPSKRAAVGMRLEETVDCDTLDCDALAEAIHVEDCLRKLVKLSKHDADSDVWEGNEWEESLQQLLDQDMLPKYPENWS